MTGQPVTIGEVFDRSVDADPTRPLVTFYDHATGDRVELSGATTRNWVDKTANLLTNALGAMPGTRVSVALPTHWQALVWVLACWRTGSVLVTGDAPADVAVIGPDAVRRGLLPAVGEVVATALHPLGARFEVPLPVGITDYGTEVFAQGDTFAAPAQVRPNAMAWQESLAIDHTALIRRAQAMATELGLPSGGRLLTDANPATPAGADTVLAPLVVGGNVVLVRHLDPARLSAITITERVDATVLVGTASANAPAG